MPLPWSSRLSSARSSERRRWPRRQVAWPITMSIEGGEPVTGMATDASLHGLRVVLEHPQAIPDGARCHIEVLLAGGQARFVRIGEVRHVSERGIGLLSTTQLPIDVDVEDTGGSARTTVRKIPHHPPGSVAAMLRSLTLPRLHH